MNLNSILMKRKITLVLAIILTVWLSAGCRARFDLVIDSHTYKVIHVSGNFGQSYVHDPKCLMRDIARIINVDSSRGNLKMKRGSKK